MQDQDFWTANLSAFSSFHRAVSVVAAWVIVGGLAFGALATASGLVG
ncbi:hypothetical protein [Terricaulis silvestris]|uniref:Uncharacterized protein n=1 Tax=Terricaulis silvestris TaxID=2686094 RepID=A0A6I6MRF2_9CAUL|nr:hypothetical protein [Terricaulis silvestris]QGZ95367.1 hypothetical protein DSM104635_02216 [Terricaulis silvestris]